jgi:hypothetical protein
VKLSDELETWRATDGALTLQSLNAAFRERSFAIAFAVLLALPALPLPTGGATHAFELIAILLACELIAGQKSIWLPRRLRGVNLDGERGQRLLSGLIRLTRRLERMTRPRFASAFGGRASNVLFGALVIVGAAAAFAAPPLSGLDTLPSLSVVVLSLGVLFEDALLVVAAIALGAAGIGLDIILGAAAISALAAIV